jgi:hypothetical protein
MARAAGSTATYTPSAWNQRRSLQIGRLLFESAVTELYHTATARCAPITAHSKASFVAQHRNATEDQKYQQQQQKLAEKQNQQDREHQWLAQQNANSAKKCLGSA